MRVAEMNVAENQLRISRPNGDALLIHLAGDWRTGHDLPSTDAVQKEVASGSGVQSVSFDTSGLTGWDSNLLVFMLKVKQWCAEKKIECRSRGTPRRCAASSQAGLSGSRATGCTEGIQKRALLFDRGATSPAVCGLYR